MIIRIDLCALTKTSKYEYISRFFFGGAVTVLAGAIAQKYGAGIGGLFLAFPAIFPASATLLERHETSARKRPDTDVRRRSRALVGVDAAGAAMGCIGLVAFALSIWQGVLHLPTWLAIAVGIVTWTVVSITVWLVRKKRWIRWKRKPRSSETG